MPCNRLLKRRPPVVYFHQNELLNLAISNCSTILWELTSPPTRCLELVAEWKDFVRVVDASSHSVGGIIIGKLSECPPTVFRLQWPPDITTSIITESNPTGTLTNSDLELVGLVLLWIMMEHVCMGLVEKQVALFSGATFKEYIHEELACFSTGMLTSMKMKFDFVNIAGNTFNTITNALIDQEYDINVSSAAAA